MKKLFFTLVLSLLPFVQSVNAKSTQDKPAIDMVSYEQRWLDDRGTIALKNNTNENIYNISFVLEYLDMNGMPLDYETFSYNIDIAPGKTKKLDIPAYEYERNYHYYKSTDYYSDHPAFKLRYELKNYNSASINPVIDNASHSNEDSSGIAISIILIVIIILSISIGLYVLVAIMAQRRNRNPFLWLLLSFLATPLLIIIILLAIGENRDEKFEK